MQIEQHGMMLKHLINEKSEQIPKTVCSDTQCTALCIHHDRALSDVERLFFAPTEHCFAAFSLVLAQQYTMCQEMQSNPAQN